MGISKTTLNLAGHHMVTSGGLCLGVGTSAAWTQYMAGDYSAAIDTCRNVMEMKPHFTPAWRVLGASMIQMGRAAEGVADTLAALRDGQASDVLIADDPSSTARAWIGPEPADVAASQEELAERGIEQAVPDRADAALARAAASTGAELHFMPEGEQPPRSGVGALLRYPVPQA